MVMNSFSGFIQKNKIIILVICLSFLLTNRNGSILIEFSCVGLAISFFPPSLVGTLVLYLPSDASHIPQKLFCRFNIFSRFVICSNCSDTSSEVIIFSLRSLSNDIIAGMASDFKEHQMPFLPFFSIFCFYFSSRYSFIFAYTTFNSLLCGFSIGFNSMLLNFFKKVESLLHW